MSAADELLALYGEWHRCTELETRAIEASAWEDVVRIQADKAALQPAIVGASETLQDRAGQVGQIRGRIEDALLNLIQGELTNRKQIDSRLAEARGQRTALDRSVNRLRDVRRAYGRSTTSEA
jgi:hypothetical protein